MSAEQTKGAGAGKAGGTASAVTVRILVRADVRFAPAPAHRSINTRRSTNTHHSYDKLLCSDGIHPTQQGHDIIDRELHSFLCA